MPYMKVGTDKNNDVMISYADYGDGQPVVLIHGWPYSHLTWEQQIKALVEAGYRVIAYDRRGFGDSYKTWDGYDYDSLASDLNALMEGLDLHDAVLIGFSMGGGEVARYLGTYGSNRIAKAVLMSAITPYMLKTDDNQDGVDQSVFDDMGKAMMSDRPAFLVDFGKQFVNWDSDGKDILSEEMLQYAWNIAIQASPRATYACANSFATTDFRSDLAKFDVPTLIMHGDADQIVPFEASGQRTHELLPDSQLVVVEGGAHGINQTQPEIVNKTLLEFIAS